MDLATMVGAAGTLKLGGRTLLLRRLTFRDIGQIQEYMKARAPSPMVALAKSIKDLEPIKQADPEVYKDLCGKLASLAYQDQKAGAVPDAVQILDTLEGTAFFLWLRSRQDAPDIASPEAMLALMQQEAEEELTRILDDFAARERAANAEAAEARAAHGLADPQKPAAK